MNYFDVEIIILSAFVILQLRTSYKCWSLITQFKTTFNSLLEIQFFTLPRAYASLDDALDHITEYEEGREIDEGDIKIPLVNYSSNHEVTKRIHDSINKYLLSNFGAPVNFSIIKDMIDREVDVKDDEISQLVSTPLYLGLAATMTGIILGLISMPNVSNEDFSEAITVLINGVKWAMAASLIGLGCTTLLSSRVYKNAKRHLLTSKNDQLSYLQAKLLPALLQAEDTGITGLKHSIDQFTRQGTKIAESLKIASINTSEGLHNQLEIIEKVEKLNMSKITKNNLELFDRLEKNMASFEKFGDHINSIENIAAHLDAFANKTSDIDLIANEIRENIQEVNYNTKESKKLTEFLTSHFQQLESHGSKVKLAVDLTESYFAEAIDKLKEQIASIVQVYTKSADTHEIELQRIYNEIGQKIKQVTEAHIEEYRKLYSEAPTHFNELKKLNLLEELSSITSNTQNASSTLSNIDVQQDVISENAKALNALVSEVTYKLTSIDSKYETLSKSVSDINQLLSIVEKKSTNGDIIKQLASIEKSLGKQKESKLGSLKKSDRPESINPEPVKKNNLNKFKGYVRSIFRKKE
jgi:ABC-type transporter Mla subunit MlaD